MVLSTLTRDLCEVIWSDFGEKSRLYNLIWTEYDESALVLDEVEIIVQVNGKLKDKLTMSKDSSKEMLEEAARNSDKVQEAIGDLNIVKAIVIPGKLVNFVAK